MSDLEAAQMLQDALERGWRPVPQPASFRMAADEVLYASPPAFLCQLKDGMWVDYGRGTLHITNRKLAMPHPAGWVEWDLPCIRDIRPDEHGILMSATDCPHTWFHLPAPLAYGALIRHLAFGPRPRVAPELESMVDAVFREAGME